MSVLQIKCCLIKLTMKMVDGKRFSFVLQVYSQHKENQGLAEN